MTFTILHLLTTEVLDLSCATAWQSRCRRATLILHPKRCTRPTGATGWLNGLDEKNLITKHEKHVNVYAMSILEAFV